MRCSGPQMRAGRSRCRCAAAAGPGTEGTRSTRSTSHAVCEQEYAQGLIKRLKLDELIDGAVSSYQVKQGRFVSRIALYPTQHGIPHGMVSRSA